VILAGSLVFGQEAVVLYHHKLGKEEEMNNSVGRDALSCLLKYKLLE
jgi:hypothetical protein